MDSNIVNYIVNIATLLTAIATFFTVLEMRKQRKESYRAVVIPIEKYYSLLSYDDGRFTGRTLNNSNYELNISIDLVNAGIGPALNIEGEWEFDFQKFVKSNTWEYEQVVFQENNLEIRASNWSVMHHIGNQTAINLECLLANSNNVAQLLLPNYITAILKIEADWRKRSKNLFIPELKLKYKYIDVGLSIIKKSYKMHFNHIVQIFIATEPHLDYDEHGGITIIPS